MLPWHHSNFWLSKCFWIDRRWMPENFTCLTLLLVANYGLGLIKMSKLLTNLVSRKVAFQPTDKAGHEVLHFHSKWNIVKWSSGGKQASFDMSRQGGLCMLQWQFVIHLLHKKIIPHKPKSCIVPTSKTSWSSLLTTNYKQKEWIEMQPSRIDVLWLE